MKREDSLAHSTSSLGLQSASATGASAGANVTQLFRFPEYKFINQAKKKITHWTFKNAAELWLFSGRIPNYFDYFQTFVKHVSVSFY